MSMLLSLDPNVLSAAQQSDPSSCQVLHNLMSYKDEFRLGIDPEYEIWNAYMDIRKHFTDDNIARRFVTRMLDLNQSYIMVVPTGVLNNSETEILVQEGCGIPVEPALIAVATTLQHSAALIVLGKELEQAGLFCRGIHDEYTVQKLHAQNSRFQNLDVWTVDNFIERIPMINRSRFPSNEDQLELFLLATENEYYEYKQPGEEENGQQISSTRLTKKIMERTMKAVCGMLNAAGGDVFVGITNDRTLMGVELDERFENDDLLQLHFRNWYSKVTPPISPYIWLSLIPLDVGRRVVRLHVLPSEQEHWYIETKQWCILYRRCGSSTEEIKRIAKSKLSVQSPHL